ncbi:MAG: efflux RND transporter periplasmic adaptor subunit [Geothrix sp.]|jgi:HlyD family secretion protein|uniref:Efflux RND transporter periplasmic adaptor subunit n=1 Tax=Candidatus Geothrix odensensis TaxID=2954440 RepID=A0A936K5T2_9BACT|nr:efflux RND transporter periplasmic adaptor subunit [Candidatus Geothrix odensensis]MBK8789357.1 efflux RND transporter periplasmic adaptor subunit [Holophagaceae bacterium]MBP7617798.1 efflux RND transporter periplasmic adaptor subunit [Geothrix sp.]MCC6513282.1 efflux RND transporter periplasmic adaptor subunit [Geothrix sp.]
MKRKQLWILGGGLAVVLVGGVAIAGMQEKGLAVQVAKVGRENLQSKVSANGKIQAVTKADISANVMGQVTKLAVKEGDLVKKGQFLMEIDPRSAKANTEAMQANLQATQSDLVSATANLAQARSDFERAKVNRTAGIISAADFERARTAFETAQATQETVRRRAEQARANLSQSHVGLRNSTITAPMDGVVTARRIELGETAVPGIQNQAGTVLVTISDMSKVEAEMEVDEASIPTVKQGQKAQVRIDAYPNQTFDGEVTEVGGSPILKLSANEAIKFKVKVWIKNPPLTIKPGLSAQADIFTGSRDQVLAIPIQSLVTREIKPKAGETPKPGAPRDEEGVWLFDGPGKAKFLPVKTGLLGDLNVEVLDGLKGGETVITGPFRILRDLKGGELVREEKSKKKDEKKG